ncbi:glycosyltransferase family 4 protein [Desulfobacter sp. UBA2225]|uniref:glycosyltransferase family 4 protein n=1 Tax=Desulfobacter sp. UBA2225 TaxID=1961413 RepID=UPI002581176E|nr:glycosyltransferase [Desulfobacter sp. UBA2225]
MTIAIHQYTPAITKADGVSNSLFFIKRMLTSLGYESEIYADNIDPELKDLVRPRRTYQENSNNILLLHHAAAQPDPGWFISLADRLAMVYHNITPAHYFETGTAHSNATKQGREQLAGWQDLFAGIIADSEYNAQELNGLGYENVHVIPLLIDFENIKKNTVSREIINRHETTFNLLFVGRICENKCQHDLIHALARLGNKNVHLFCVGGNTSPPYLKYIKKLVAGYGLQEQVHLPGKVSDQDLWGYYHAADLFVSLSDHEGFGIPLIEASSIGLPVVAYDSSNIRHTLAGSGLILSHKNSTDVASVLQRLMTQPLWRHRLAKGEQANLSRFDFENLKTGLNAFINSLLSGTRNTIDLHHPAADKKSTLKISFEGPFDSNYSLALVNRELALALQDQGFILELHSTEGGGDFSPDEKFLNYFPRIKKMWNRGVRQEKADLAIRNLFPPRVSGMNGALKILAPYAWEESVFPGQWIDAFNIQLHLVGAVSGYVARTLKNNGITVPTITMGNGVDHLKEVAPEPLPFRFPPGYTLLHISSCFPRKGADLLLKAFTAADFGARPEVTLIIKTFPNPHNSILSQLDKAGWVKEQQSQLFFYNGTMNSKKKILLVEDELSPGQLVSLYRHSDLLVAPSRGEGFGLPMAEAMVFGLPVLTTGFGGQTDFCSHETAWLTDYKFSRARTHMALPDSVWVEPDLGDLTRQMEHISRLPAEKINRKTRAAKENILKNYAWRQVSKRLTQAIETLDHQNCPATEPRIGWVTTWNTRCGIASYSKYLVRCLSVGKVTVLANNALNLTEQDGPEVIRCWEADEKDSLQQLVHRIVAAGITDIVIQFNFSFFNLNALSGFLDTMKGYQKRCYLFLHSTADVLPPHAPKSLSQIRSSLFNTHRLIVHSVHDLNHLKSMGCVENVMRFPHGVDVSPHSLARTGGTSFPAPDHPPTHQPHVDEKLIAAYGFLLPHKGIRELICAFELLKKKTPDLKLLLLNALYPAAPASKEEQRLCLQQIKESPYGNDITMDNGYLEEKEIFNRLSRANVIVYPCQTTQESSSASVRAGLATGRPIAVTPLDIFEDVSDVVYTLPGTTPEHMAQGIETMINNREISSRLMSKQKQWLLSHDWQVLGRQLGNIIKGCAVSLH